MSKPFQEATGTLDFLPPFTTLSRGPETCDQSSILPFRLYPVLCLRFHHRRLAMVAPLSASATIFWSFIQRGWAGQLRLKGQPPPLRTQRFSARGPSTA